MTLMVSQVDCEENHAETVIFEGIENAVSKTQFSSLELQDFETDYFRSGYYVVEIDVMAHDYGVPEIGIDLISSWCGKVFDFDLPFIINELLIHPSDHTYGTLIKYDPELNKVMVVRLEKSDETQSDETQ